MADGQDAAEVHGFEEGGGIAERWQAGVQADS